MTALFVVEVPMTDQQPNDAGKVATSSLKNNK